MTAPVDEAVISRMVAFIRKWEESGRETRSPSPLLIEARAIAALLPEPVDPDLVEARTIVSCRKSGWYGPNEEAAIDRGERDGSEPVQCALLGIKRGRALAEQERS